MSQPQVIEVNPNDLYEDPLFLPETEDSKAPAEEAEVVDNTEEVKETTPVVDDGEDHSELEAELLGLDKDDDKDEEKTDAPKLEERLEALKTDVAAVFDNIFQEKFGVSVEEAKAILAGADQVVAKDSVAAQEQELKQLWGDGYEDNMARVLEQWKKLSPKLQAKYDNAEGVKLIYNKLPKQTQATKSAPASRETVKLMGSRSTKQTPVERQNAPMFKQSELLTMSATEYRKNDAAITKAYAEGRVLFDAE